MAVDDAGECAPGNAQDFGSISYTQSNGFQTSISDRASGVG